MLVNMLPQYYEVRTDGLFIRQGWRKALVRYADLVEPQSTTGARIAGVFSIDRILWWWRGMGSHGSSRRPKRRDL